MCNSGNNLRQQTVSEDLDENDLSYLWKLCYYLGMEEIRNTYHRVKKTKENKSVIKSIKIVEAAYSINS